MGELKPCPLCNSPALLERDNDHHGAWFNLGCSVGPNHAGDGACILYHAVYTEDAENEAETVLAWNTRPRTEGRGEGEPVAKIARRVLDATSQDIDGYWFVGGEDPEELLAELATALDASSIREPEISREALGEAIYLALYKHQGAVWAANESKDVWYDAADRLRDILNLAPVGGQGEEAKASPFLSFEDSLDRLVIYTAMEDGQLALNCERVIKAEYERLLTALQAKEEEIQSDVRAILALRSDLDAAQSSLAEALGVLRPFARVYDELCGRGLSYAISGDDGVIYADDDNFADASDLVQRFSTGRVDGVEL